jgi:EmrB/QacA subfamily drug resistance transporter
MTSASTRSHNAVLVVTCLALATVMSAMASLNVALPSIARSTHASQTELAWVVDAYSLVFAALLLVGGAIGDRFGRRLALLVGLAIFGGGSAVAPFTADPQALIVLRGVLGVGAAVIMPATLSTITSTFPREQRAKAVGVWAGVAGASAILGLLSSGALLVAFSWRSIFLLNVGLAAIAIVGTIRFVPESADPKAPRIDTVGAALTVVGLMAFVYSIIEAPDRGWSSPATLTGLSFGVAVLTGFVTWELRVAHPLIDPRLFRLAPFAAGTASLTLQFFAFFGFIFVAMQYLQLVRGDSAIVAAVSVLPFAVTMMPSARLAGHVSARIGQRGCGVLGLLLVATGLAILATLDGGSSYWHIVVGLLPLGAGMGLAMTPATTAVTDALPTALQGVGSAMNDLSRELGGALGIAVLGSLLSASYRSHLHLTGLPPGAAEQARSSLAVAAHFGPSVRLQAQHAFTDAMQVALFGGAIVTAAAAAAVGFLLRHHDESLGASEASSPSQPAADGALTPA